MSEEKKTGLELLREPFPASQISKLPKPTAAQTKEVKEDYKKGVRCEICGTWHHPKVVHLDYVGHAALTARLLDCDPSWNWSPLALDEKGLPVVDKDGGMWISLTVCGVTRLGYGDSQDKTGPNATKERIGDALRNAAMRFGAALDLWSKADLHSDEEVKEEPKQDKVKADGERESLNPAKDQAFYVKDWCGMMEVASKGDLVAFSTWWTANKPDIIRECGEDGAKQVHAAFNATSKLLAQKMAGKVAK